MKLRLLWIILLLAGLAFLLLFFPRSKTEPFDRFMTLGRGYLQKGDATNAIDVYSQAIREAPESVDAHLNLANALLLANKSQGVIDECQKVIQLNPNEPAAYYLMGCAYLRENQPEPAIQAFQQSQNIDPAVDALNFQLGIAHERAGHLPEAIQQFETLIQFSPEHPSAHYQLSRLYQRTDRAQEAAEHLAKHQQIQAGNPGVSLSPAYFERCKYTEPRIAFTLEQPVGRGPDVRFVDATTEAFGQEATRFRGPIAALDYNHDGRNSLMAVEETGFRLLDNNSGRFTPLGTAVGFPTNSPYQRCLVGDLNNDRFEDVLFISEKGCHALRFATNGQFREVTTAAGLKNFKARDALLADLDFTGKLDLLGILPGGTGLKVYRNLGSLYFQESTNNSGLPVDLPGTAQAIVDDWANQDVPGVFVARTGQPSRFLIKQRAGEFVETNLVGALPASHAIATGDLNNDLLLDLALAGEREISFIFGGSKEALKIPLKGFQPNRLRLLDYDNDGWLDLIAYSAGGVRAWRNRGNKGFEDMTSQLNLNQVGAIDDLAAADFDSDGDTDLITSSTSGLHFWRNDGGNANRQLKLQLVGNRSNASCLGARVELASGHWRTIRTLHELPFEIGVGKNEKIDVLHTRWSDLATTILEIPVKPAPVEIVELTLPTGSCPYLYAWDGKTFNFVTDILGAAPLGLPISHTRYVDDDPEEFLWLGSDRSFPPKEDAYEVRITEELREVLYLDNAALVVVDHSPDTMVVPTSKMLPSKPFSPHELWTVRPLYFVKHATRSDGLEVTATLKDTDGDFVSPVHLREPQLRGLAEPFAITMDFGELNLDKPLVMVMHGWLRFGGGMANIGASLDPNLPFPFPKLEVELADGKWQEVAVDVGVPAGKTKTILVDLDRKLPRGTRKFRLSMAFELYWDSIIISERVSTDKTHITRLEADRANLKWRGFSSFSPLPSIHPLTPDYDQVSPNPPWRRTPFGWCTRYGSVEMLLKEKDNALALLNGGDELALSFLSNRIPPKPESSARTFFLQVVGWDKDADFHVGEGWRVEPLPFHGMDAQAYGRQPRPRLNDDWITEYNTRWVGPLVLRKARPKILSAE